MTAADTWLEKWKKLDPDCCGDHWEYREEARLRRVAKKKGLYLVKMRGEASRDARGEYLVIRKNSGMSFEKARETIEGKERE